ncbi:MAG: hypothetical protein DI603_17910 [Roseateles depolymerans]|uniref:Uncharacterized protein n=1 Tax=Roseateles depolymerans TaxID=76731 RepID=A0A2W5DKX1_9BURK|nr:MAG: hypothetical protein DI603_17910 [Roseateles depolymerans]
MADQAKRLMLESPQHEAFVRHALRIPHSMRVLHDLWSVGEVLVFSCLPVPLRAARARRLLGRVGSYEGRKLIFRRHISPSLPEKLHYDEALDIALGHLPSATATRADLQYWDRSRPSLVKLAMLLKLETVAEVRSAFPPDPRRRSDHLLRLLIEEGAIRSSEELSWAGSSDSRVWSPGDKPDAEEAHKLRLTVRQLLDLGIERRQVAGVLRYPLWALDPELLAANASLLSSTEGTDLNGTLARVGDRLWRTSTATWRFVLTTIGARTPAELGQFRQLLDCRHALSSELVSRLKLLGAGLADLETCQRLLLALDPSTHNVGAFIGHVQRLSRPPHALDLAQLSQCASLLLGDEALEPFLQVLSRHDLADADAVMEFKGCFRKVWHEPLDRTLTILEAAGCDEPLEERVGWVMQAGQQGGQVAGFLDSIDYLVSALQLRGLQQLQPILKLAPLGVPFLRCVIEERGLDTLKSLRGWYYEARGIENFRSYGTYDDVDRLLFHDAFDRNQFNLLETNTAAMQAIAQVRVERALGRWPWQGSEEEQELYRQATRELKRQIRAELLPVLPLILGETRGVLLPSLFDDETDESWDLHQRLARLSPVLAELMQGRGPVGDALTPLELDAIALVYRTPHETIRTTWPKLLGRQVDLQGLILRPAYAMSWRHVRWRLRYRLDRDVFFALGRAADFCRQFGSDQYRNMFAACQRLKPKQLGPTAGNPDVRTLAWHLGSLLVLARADSVVGRWVDSGFDALTGLDEDTLDAYQRMTELQDLFKVVLPDALDAHAEAYIARLSDDDAVCWASRLGPPHDSLSGRDLLRALVQRTRDRVLPAYAAWARRQVNRYKKDDDTSRLAQPLTAMVSKQPAVFFARKAANLCTAGNVAMWTEPRHAHLLVFDQAGQRLAGMAYLYVQAIPELDRKRKSLVIRAINPTEDMVGGHEIRSIVETFLDTAIQIAEDNGLGCVAFPALTGAHVVSNRSQVEAYVKARYVERAKKRYGTVAQAGEPPLREQPQPVDVTFYAYEHGEEPVGTLYVVWRPEATVPERADREADLVEA